MRSTLTSIIALGFAISSTNAVLAQDADADDNGETMQFAEDQQRFTDAGFEGAQVLHNIEVARVTHDGETYFVVKGIGDQMGMGMQQGQLGQQPGQDMQAGQAATGLDQQQPGAETGLAADPQPGAETGLAADPQPGAETGLAADQQPGAETGMAADQQPGAETGMAAEQQPGAETGMAAEQQPGAETGMAADQQPGMETDVAWDDRSLEELLEEAGIEDYEILDDVRVATTRMGEGAEGQEVHVFYGFEADDTDS